MRILEVSIPQDGNVYFANLCNGLAKTCRVVHNHNKFWHQSEPFDIIHIHWPEYLSYEIEDCLIRNELDGAVMGRLQRTLQEWGKTSRIVVTRHNVRPHGLHISTAFDELYRLVYAYADAVIHMGEFSRKEYLDRYRDLAALNSQQQAVIPHPAYMSVPNNVSKVDARKKLNLRQDSVVVLAFGGFNNDKESKLVMEAFRQLDVFNKTLLVPRWRAPSLSIGWVRARRYADQLRRFFYRLHPQFQLESKFVPHEAVQYYLNAADVLFVQRLHPLNSGNLVLGFSFGTVVAGPDTGNVGEILRGTGNPVFEPGDADSAGSALEEGLEKSKRNLGDRNKHFAMENWRLDTAIQRHLSLFSRLLA